VVTIEEIAAAVNNAASKLFEQFKYSNGFTSVGQSALAEAALVTHIAAEFISNGHAVWPESPFRTAKRGRTKRLDLLVQLEPTNLGYLHVLTFEGKAISKGFESTKVTEIIADHTRICDWRVLDPSGRPIFFSLDPPQSVTGLLAVLLTENAQNGVVPQQSLSGWWDSLLGYPLGVTQEKAQALKRILSSSAKKDIVRSPIPLGNARLSVAYAIFTCGDLNSQHMADAAEDERTADHEAAHALVALICGFKVERIALHASGKLGGGAFINWKASRRTIPDEELLEQAFAVAYAGSIMEMNRSGRSIGETLVVLPTDTDLIEDIRKTATDWGMVSNASETAKFSKCGMQLGTTIIQESADLIALLADELLVRREMNESSIQVWFEEYRNR
jgi:hypothetical protein